MHNFTYFFAIVVLITGLFIMLTSDNFIKKVIGLTVFQNAVIIFYIALGKLSNDLQVGYRYVYSSSIPHVLMLTAIVVGFATTCIGFALIYQIYKIFNTIQESEINKKI